MQADRGSVGTEGREKQEKIQGSRVGERTGKGEGTSDRRMEDVCGW